MNETGPETVTGQAPGERDNELEGLYGLTDDLVRDIGLAAQEERREDIPALVADLHAADLADLLEHLGSTDRIVVIQASGDQLDAEVVAHLDETVREEMLGLLDTGQLAAVITERGKLLGEKKQLEARVKTFAKAESEHSTTIAALTRQLDQSKEEVGSFKKKLAAANTQIVSLKKQLETLKKKQKSSAD